MSACTGKLIVQSDVGACLSSIASAGVRAGIHSFIHSYSFIANCQTTVVHKNKTKHRSKIYKSQYIFQYNILTVKLQSVIREMRSGSCLL